MMENLNINSFEELSGHQFEELCWDLLNQLGFENIILTRPPLSGHG
jgi:hypothetical protein